MSQGLRISVKTARIFIKIEGVIPGTLLDLLRDEYGNKLIVRSFWGERMRDLLAAPLYETRPAEMSPGDYLRRFRLDKDLTQAELGTRLGGVPRQNVCNMEKGRRPISRMMAIRLSRFFGVSIEKFIGDQGLVAAHLAGRAVRGAAAVDKPPPAGINIRAHGFIRPHPA